MFIHYYQRPLSARPTVQCGYGFGGIIRGIAREMIPLVKVGAKTILSEVAPPEVVDNLRDIIPEKKKEVVEDKRNDDQENNKSKHDKINDKINTKNQKGQGFIKKSNRYKRKATKTFLHSPSKKNKKSSLFSDIFTATLNKSGKKNKKNVKKTCFKQR